MLAVQLAYLSQLTYSQTSRSAYSQGKCISCKLSLQKYQFSSIVRKYIKVNVLFSIFNLSIFLDWQQCPQIIFIINNYVFICKCLTSLDNSYVHIGLFINYVTQAATDGAIVNIVFIECIVGQGVISVRVLCYINSETTVCFNKEQIDHLNRSNEV